MSLTVGKILVNWRWKWLGQDRWEVWVCMSMQLHIYFSSVTLICDSELNVITECRVGHRQWVTLFEAGDELTLTAQPPAVRHAAFIRCLIGLTTLDRLYCRVQSLLRPVHTGNLSKQHVDNCNKSKATGNLLPGFDLSSSNGFVQCSFVRFVVETWTCSIYFDLYFAKTARIVRHVPATNCWCGWAIILCSQCICASAAYNVLLQLLLPVLEISLRLPSSWKRTCNGCGVRPSVCLSRPLRLIWAASCSSVVILVCGSVSYTQTDRPGSTPTRQAYLHILVLYRERRR